MYVCMLGNLLVDPVNLSPQVVNGFFCGGSFCFMSWCLKYFCAVGALCMFSYF